MGGKEPACFARLFNGHMIIHRGRRDDVTARTRWRLYVLRNELSAETCLWEIPAECRSMRSRGSFVLADCEQFVLYVWHGAKSPRHTQQCVMDVANWIANR